MLLDRNHGRIKPKPYKDIGPGVDPTEYNPRQYKQLDAAAPEFYPEDTIGGSTTAKDKPRMRVTLTLETCLEKIMLKQGATREDQDRTSTTTSNSQQIPGQQNRSEHQLNHKRGPWLRNCLNDDHAPTHQGGSSYEDAKTHIMVRKRKQRGGKSGGKVRGNLLDTTGNQKGVPNGRVRNEEVVEIMYNKEDREPPDETDRAARIDEIRTEPFVVWYVSIKI